MVFEKYTNYYKRFINDFNRSKYTDASNSISGNLESAFYSSESDETYVASSSSESSDFEESDLEKSDLEEFGISRMGKNIRINPKNHEEELGKLFKKLVKQNNDKRKHFWGQKKL